MSNSIEETEILLSKRNRPERNHDDEEEEPPEKYPTSLFCIIATEFCERFSFCGLRTILSLYLRDELSVAENKATVVYHVFIMLCYLVPLLGAVLADSYFGRYKTILYFSLIYLFGNILTCLAAIPPMELPPLNCTVLGLVLIAFGTGGIKPCVAAFGGDQFVLPQQQHRLQSFFSTFYFTINFGGFIGMIITPILRKAITCYGKETCYAVGFGFPAALMLLALLLFILGKPWYRMKKPKGEILIKFFTTTIQALKNKWKYPEESHVSEHWLDMSKSTDRKLLSDMKIMYAIMWLFIPLPLFWSLFDQQGSRWTFQASRTNGTLRWGRIQILPDQMQVINPAIVLLLIPVFERVVYPRCPFVLGSPLRRMVAGGLMAGCAFLASGLLELKLEATYPHLPKIGTSSLNVINTLPCPVRIIKGITDDVVMDNLEPGGMGVIKDIPTKNFTEYNFILMVKPKVSFRCGENHNLLRLWKTTYIVLKELQTDTAIVSVTDIDDIQVVITEPVQYSKSISGKPRVRIAYIHSTFSVGNLTVSLISNFDDLTQAFSVSEKQRGRFTLSPYIDLIPGIFTYKIESTAGHLYGNGTIQLEIGGVYTLVIREFRQDIDFVKLYTMTKPNTVHMFWLIPQYFLISVGEIMFAISGLEFSFTQAPKSMKTITIAAWYLSVALGNFLVILITQAKFFTSQAYEFFLFAILIALDMLLFAKMAEKYEIIQIQPDGSSIHIFKKERQPLIEKINIKH